MNKEKNYKLLKVVLAWFFFVLFLIGGCGSSDTWGRAKPKLTEEEIARIPLPQRSGLPECSGGFALAVSGETVTSDEVILPLIEYFRPIAQRNSFEQFKEQAKPVLEQVLVTKVSNILLYSQAKREMGERIDERLEKAAEAGVRKFIVSFEGDYARAEEALEEMGMDWHSFREYQKKMILSQSYISTQLPQNEPITHSELMDCYNNMKDKFFTTPAMMKFRLIDIEPAKLEVADPEQSRHRKAKELANELVRQIYEGSDFGELAKQYSHGHRRAFGGLWKPVQPGALAEPYDVLATEAEKIEPGQIAGPIEAAEHIFIIKLEERRAKSFEPFEKVQGQVEAKIIFDRRKKAVDELSTKLTQQAALGKKDEFINFCLGKIYRISNQ